MTNDFDPRLKRVIAMIQENLSADLSADALSRRLGISKSRLEHVFRSWAGISLHRFIKRRRLESAADLLVSTNKTVKEILALTGIADQSHFFRAFKRHFGCTPRRYRRAEKSRIGHIK